MTEDGLLLLTHCHTQIFCLSVPDECPSCGEELRGRSQQEGEGPAVGGANRRARSQREGEGSARGGGACRRGRGLLEAPVRLHSPLRDGHQSSCCLLVHTHSDFDGTSELHTGISNTSGLVYNYTRAGVCRDASGWERCVSVPLVRPDMFHLRAQWDQDLERFSEGPMWDPAWTSFDEERHNCFTFCLAFVNGVLAAEGRGPVSAEAFTRDHVLPRVRRAARFAALHRHLRTNRYYVVDRREERQVDP